MTPAAKILERLDAKDPEWRKTALALYDIGGSDREVMRELELTPHQFTTLYNAIGECDFQELVDIGRLYAHAWWETEGRKNLKNKGFNAQLWTIQMKNRFGWSEKTEQSMTNIDFSNMDSDELMREIKQLHEKLEGGRGRTAV